MTAPARPLVIGIGNPLRRDDGVGWRLAAEWGLLQGSGAAAQVLAVQQLLPELAEAIAQSSRVLFIDAAIEAAGPRPTVGALCAGAPWLQRLGPDRQGATARSLSHSLDPDRLLTLAEQLYGAQPRAHRLLLQGRQLGHGTAYSATLRRQLPAARQLLQHWLEAADA